MNPDEIALQLTLKAMELGRVNMVSLSSSEKEIEKWNAFNAKQISDFMTALTKEYFDATL